MLPIIAGTITFVFTTLLTIAGVGAASILIPLFIAIGINVHSAISTALLLNTIAMIFASIRFAKKKLIMWKTAIPILITAMILSPIGAWVSQSLNKKILLGLFVIFLFFSAIMMLFYKAKEKQIQQSKTKQIIIGIFVGALAGFVGGLLGIGGGNILIPVLVWLGYNPKKVSATTAFIVIFSSFSGFLAHLTIATISYKLILFTGTAAAFAAILGSYLMTDKLNKKQVKIIIGIILLGIAFKMLYKLIF